MDADMLDQAPRNCFCGRSLDSGAHDCDACGQPVASTGETTRLDPPASTDATTRLPPPASTGVTTRLRLPGLFTGLSREEAALLLAAIREGMRVRSSDGKRLGKAVQVHGRASHASRHDAWLGSYLIEISIEGRTIHHKRKFMLAADCPSFTCDLDKLLGLPGLGVARVPTSPVLPRFALR